MICWLKNEEATDARIIIKDTQFVARGLSFMNDPDDSKQVTPLPKKIGTETRTIFHDIYSCIRGLFFYALMRGAHIQLFLFIFFTCPGKQDKRNADQEKYTQV